MDSFMNILCTGSSGLVASDFKNLCKEKRIPFFGIDLNGEGESVDITNYDQLSNYIKNLCHPDPSADGVSEYSSNKNVISNEVEKSIPTLFHFAAITFTGHNLTPTQIDLCKKVNIKGTKNITKICSELNIPLVHISTDFVFSGGKKTSPYLPSDPLTPDDTIYSQTKAESEKIVLTYDNSFIIRIAFPYGNFGNPKPCLVRKMLNWMEKEEVNLYSDQKINPTPISFISNSCLKLVQLISEKKLKAGRILHLVGTPSTPYEFGKLVKEVFQKSAKLNPISAPAGTTLNSILDTKETEEILEIKIPEHRQELQRLI